MSLKTDIVHTVDLPEGQAATHAIVIGVGSYPHGRSALTKSTVTDLLSPVPSATAMANWLINDFDHPERPLATVSLIVSADEPFVYRNPITGVDYEVPQGTAAEVERYVRDWVTRAAANPENGCIFYFCGHGVRSGQRDAVLTRSYGEDPYDSLSGIFERASLQNALRILGPQHQLLMFDTCRKDDPSVFEGNDNLTNFLKVSRPAPGLSAVQQSRLFAAAEGFEAYGRTCGGPSLFATEFLKACTHAVIWNGDWWVESTLVQQQIARAIGDQQCQHEGVGTSFCRLNDDPIVPVVVHSKPSSDLERMRIACSSKTGVQWSFDGSAELEVTEWRLELQYDTYDFTASACRVDDFQTINNSSVMIFPPYRMIMIDIERGVLK